MPPEFLLLQYKPRPWTPADSVAVGKLLAEYLSASWQLDLMRASMANLPKEKREALLPDTSPLDVLVVGSDRASSKSASRDVKQTLPAALVPDKQLLTQLNDLIENERRSFERLGLVAATPETIQASNNWVVSGKRTASGKPLLANDPHIPASAPGIWYQTELIAPGLHVAGVGRVADVLDVHDVAVTIDKRDRERDVAQDIQPRDQAEDHEHDRHPNVN